MRFSLALLSLVSAVTARSIVPGDVTADSAFGAKLLSKATVIEHARHLDQDRDVTFVAKYSLRYTGCSSLVQVNPEGAGGDEGMLYTQHLVRFALCPTASCASCSGGGEYVVNMLEFIDLYTEAKLTEKEYACEMIRENCYCDNANDDEVCENQCYVQAGMEDCIEYEGEEEFEIQEYLECAEMENNNDNNNNNNGANYADYANGDNYYGNLFVGPYCNPSDGKSIHLGVFYDEGCTSLAPMKYYSSRMYGAELPFSSEPLVGSECISCEQIDEDNDDNNNNNNDDGDIEVKELCEQTYEMAARCEANMDIQYQDTSACDYINNILPRLESASRSLNKGISSNSKGATTAKVFSVVFAFTTALFAAYAYFLYRKIKRGSVSLASQE